MIQFNYYAADIKKSKPLGVVTLDQFFEAIKNPKPHIIELFDKIRQAELDGDMGKKAELKTGLYSFTPCILVEGNRAYKSIKEFTGLMVLDFDHLTPDYAKEFKAFLYNSYEFIIAAWLSASRCGVRALVNIPKVNTVEEFKALFWGLAHYEMAQYNGFDMAPQNCVLPLFLSYDPDLYLGDTNHAWHRTYIPQIPPPIQQYKYEADPTKVESLMIRAISKIHDNGHPQLRAAAFALGGYVGAGYIEYDQALDLIHSLIDGNSYLNPTSKTGYKKSEVYKKTAKTMIDKGIQKPLFL